MPPHGQKNFNLWTHKGIRRWVKIGRPRKSINNIDTSKGGYTKETIEFRKEQEKLINGDLDKWKVPDFIKGNKVATKEFKRLAEELKDREILSNVDNILLGQYCQLYSNYVECINKEREFGLFTEYTNKGGQTNLIEAPWVKLRRQIETQMINISKSFGFDPVSRLRFTEIVKQENEDDELLKILKG